MAPKNPETRNRNSTSCGSSAISGGTTYSTVRWNITPAMNPKRATSPKTRNLPKLFTFPFIFRFYMSILRLLSANTLVAMVELYFTPPREPPVNILFYSVQYTVSSFWYTSCLLPRDGDASIDNNITK